MKAFRWVGSPGVMTLFRFRRVHICLTRWNNLAPRHVYRATRYARQANGYQSRRKGQIVVPLRRFKVNRKSLYLKVSWGY